ncbi:MAG TPA: hypothetical protein VNI77_06715 [Nitrososphaera sp.]|nr:hypothetical protein [Nitrososphaera sp.]
MTEKCEVDLESCYIMLMHNGDLKTCALFGSPLAYELISTGSALIYITGLIGFVAWLGRSKGRRAKDSTRKAETARLYNCKGS